MGVSLRDDVYWCDANTRIVLLDGLNDRYFALPSATGNAFRAVAAGVPISDKEYGELAPLVTRGLLVEELNTAFRQAVRLPEVTESALDISSRPSAVPPIGALLSHWRIAENMKRRPLHALLDQVASRKAAAGRRGTASSEETRDAVRRLLLTRRWISGQSQCLRWSLATMAYLAQFGSTPTFVIGVKTAPFAAHAWVQDGNTVLNDSVDMVLPYTPILAI